MQYNEHNNEQKQKRQQQQMNSNEKRNVNRLESIFCVFACMRRQQKRKSKICRALQSLNKMRTRANHNSIK